MHGILMLLPLGLLWLWLSRSRPWDGYAAARGAAAPRRPAGPSIDSRVFQLAARSGGRLTVSDVVIGTGMTIADSRRTMEGLSDGQRVRMEVTELGTIEFLFPEIIVRSREQRAEQKRNRAAEPNP